MKHLHLYLGLLALFFLAGCAAQTGPTPEEAALRVSDGTTEKIYSVADLEALPVSEASFGEFTYVGVPLSTLLEDAGFDPDTASAVKAVAADGFSANYEPALFNKADTLVSYARADGPLVEDEGPFRMVLPDQEGKLNVRMLAEIRVIP